MFRVYQKQIEKKCLLRFQIKTKPLKTIKTTLYEKHRIRIFPKVFDHRFCQKFDISSTLIFMQTKPRKSIWEPPATSCNPRYSHVKNRENKYSKDDFRRSIQQKSLSEQRKHRFQKPRKLPFFPRGQSMDLIKKLKILLTIRFIQKKPREKYLLKFWLENQPFQTILTWI